MSQDSSTLDQTLQKTDLGHAIKQHKTSLIIAFIMIIAAAIGANIYLESKQNAENNNLDKLYTFRTQAFEPFKKGTIPYDQFKTKLSNLSPDLVSSPLALPLVSDMAQTLSEKNQPKHAIELLEKTRGRMDKGSLSTALLSFQLTALYENQGEFKNAINVLEEVLKGGQKEIEVKVYFDLARNNLYLKNNEAASKNFEYVVKNFDDTEYAKMAKLYLEKL